MRHRKAGTTTGKDRTDRTHCVDRMSGCDSGRCGNFWCDCRASDRSSLLFAALVIASLAVVLAGFVVAVTGIGVGIAIHSVPAVLLMAGIGLILIALGVLATLFTGKLCIVMYPAMFRFIVKLCRKPFHRKAVSE